MDRALQLIKHYEGLARLHNGLVYPYTDAAGYATIGYGNRFYQNGTPVAMNDKPISVIDAENLLEFYVDKTRRSVASLLKIAQNSCQIDALTSFAYNLGVNALRDSTLLRKINQGQSSDGITTEFMKWVNAGGKRLAGLVKRRESEALLYQHGTLFFGN